MWPRAGEGWLAHPSFPRVCIQLLLAQRVRGLREHRSLRPAPGDGPVPPGTGAVGQGRGRAGGGVRRPQEDLGAVLRELLAVPAGGSGCP